MEVAFATRRKECILMGLSIYRCGDEILNLMNKCGKFAYFMKKSQHPCLKNVGILMIFSQKTQNLGNFMLPWRQQSSKFTRFSVKKHKI